MKQITIIIIALAVWASTAAAPAGALPRGTVNANLSGRLRRYSVNKGLKPLVP